MNRKKNLAVGLAFCISVQFLCACGIQKPTMPDKVYVGVTCYNKSDTFLGELLACFENQLQLLEKEGLETSMTVRDATGSQRIQNDQVKELIDAGCNVLCVNLVDRANPSEIIDLAREHDVPIIFFNREPVMVDLMQWDKLYYIGANAKESGTMQGELAGSLIRANSQVDRNKDGKIQYVVLEGEAGHQDTIIRTEAAVNALKNCGVELEKLSYQFANWNRAQAQNRMVQMIGKYHNKIELVLANNDDMALGAMDAYGKLNVTESAYPVFFGIDGTDVGLEAVLNGKMAGTVYNDKQGQTAAMAELAVAAVTGKGMENIKLERNKYIYLPYFKITKDNANKFLSNKKSEK